MPKYLCSNCKRLQQVSVKSLKYLSPIEKDYLCSMRCVVQKILTSDMPKSMMGKVYVLSRSRGDEAYSTTLDMYFRSKYEKCVAESIVRHGVHKIFLAYEQYGFKMANGSLYVPDFTVLNRCLVEVKGKWGIGGKSKMVDFRIQFPDIPFVFVHWGLRKEFYEDS